MGSRLPPLREPCQRRLKMPTQPAPKPIDHVTILWMATEHIVAMLIAERVKLTKAIEALSGPTKRRGRPPKNPVAAAGYTDPTIPDWVKPAAAKKPARKKRHFSAAQRKAALGRMRARWAEKKAEATPKAARKAKAA